ncbi:MAG: hypothetical protein AB8B84_00125 [Granulosicoccus sp.]
MQGKSQQASFKKVQPNAQSIDQSSVQACARSLAADTALELPALDSLTHFSRSVARGQYDSLALKKAHHDDIIQRRFSLADSLSQHLFFVLEKARYEALGANQFEGVGRNLDANCKAKYSSLRAYDSSEALSRDQLEHKTVMLCRDAFSRVGGVDSNFLNSANPSDNIARFCQPWLSKLSAVLDDQMAFAQLSSEFSDKLSRYYAGDQSLGIDVDNGEEQPDDLVVQEKDTDEEPDSMELGDSAAVEDQEETEEVTAEGDSDTDDTDALPEQALDEAPIAGPDPTIHVSGDTEVYRVFSKDFDETAHASQLATNEQLNQWRVELDEHIAVHGRLVRRLAGRLQRVLLAQQKRQWQFDLEEGQLDSARLARIVTDPLVPLSFKAESETPFRNTTITLLIDNSRSMLGRPIMIAAACADILARTMERCGVTVEILGFTTCHLHGGCSTEAWEQLGSPENPGRLNDLRHIIYKSADTSYRSSRRNLGLMLDRDILKQNIDGEALTWAYQRLNKRPEQRRILMILSDGAPVDTSTLGANAGDYLARHLQSVVDDIERSRNVELMAIGIGHDVGRFYSQAVSVFDARQLGPVMLGQLETLFRQAA